MVSRGGGAGADPEFSVGGGGGGQEQTMQDIGGGIRDRIYYLCAGLQHIVCNC